MNAFFDKLSEYTLADISSKNVHSFRDETSRKIIDQKVWLCIDILIRQGLQIYGIQTPLSRIALCRYRQNTP